MSFDSDLRVCQLCCLRPASQLCSCNDTLTYLCSLCLPLHQSSPCTHFLLSLTHKFVPLQKLKTERIKQGKAELWSNLEQVDQCCREFTRSVDATVAMVEEFRDCVLEQLEGWKGQLRRDILAATEQVERTDEPGSPLARALLNYTPGSLVLFKYSIAAPDLASYLDNWVITEMRSPCAPAVSARIYPIAVLPAQLLRFDTNSLQWKSVLTFQEEIDVDPDSSVIEVEEGKWLVCGGCSPCQSSYLIDSNQPQRLNNMLEARGLAGAIFHQESSAAYLFGGIGALVSPLKACECFSLSAQVWTALPAMFYPRKAFNPCRCNSLIYLCGGPAVETFDPQTEDFQVISLVADLGPVVSVSKEGEVLLAGAQICRITGQKVEKTGEEVRDVRTWSQSTAVLKEDFLFFVDLNRAKGCVCIDFLGNQQVFPLP